MNIFYKTFLTLFSLLTNLVAIENITDKSTSLEETLFFFILNLGLLYLTIYSYFLKIVINEEGINVKALFSKKNNTVYSWDNIMIEPSIMSLSTVQLGFKNDKKHRIELNRLVYNNINPALKLILYYGEKNFYNYEVERIKFHMNKHIWNFTWFSDPD